jgi:antitoxin VapB
LQDKIPVTGSGALRSRTRLGTPLDTRRCVHQRKKSSSFLPENPLIALNIKGPETDRLARRLSMLTGESSTLALKTAVRERIEREERTRGKVSYEELMAIAKRIASRIEREAGPLTRSSVTTTAVCLDDGRWRRSSSWNRMRQPSSGPSSRRLMLVSPRQTSSRSRSSSTTGTPGADGDLDLFLVEAGVENVPVTAA